MNKVITTGKLPIKLWLDDLEDGALQQAINLANLPFAFKHIAIMPDSHQGYGMPIGGVLATKGAIVPNAVGVDIGCGMCAIRTNLVSISTQTLETIVDEIKEIVPTGFSHHPEPQELSLMPMHSISNLPVINEQFQNARTQIGTLGGGNHFIEIQQDRRSTIKHIWIMLHSGSRNLGYQVARHYNKEAQRLNTRWYSSVPKEHQLAFLPINTPEAHLYIEEMQYCVQFSLANRQVMLKRILRVFEHHFPKTDWRIGDTLINIAHNYTNLENHFGENVWVHRKGATSAHAGQLGIIPGSQGTKSYIVRGLDNEMSFKSCSHGAGRKMGRKAAQRTLSLIQEQKKMQGIVHSITSESDLDEAPGAYKDINKVMKDQGDLVNIEVELTPIAVIKG